jgi:hypothetical protein
MLSKKRQKSRKASVDLTASPISKVPSSSQPRDVSSPSFPEDPAPPKKAINILLTRARGAFHRSVPSSSSAEVFVQEPTTQPEFLDDDLARSTASLPFPSAEPPVSSATRFWQRSAKRQSVRSYPSKPGWLSVWGNVGKGKESSLKSPISNQGGDSRYFSRSFDDVATFPGSLAPPERSGRSVSSDIPRKSLLGPSGLDFQIGARTDSWVSIRDAKSARRTLSMSRKRVFCVPLAELLEADGTTVPVIVERCLHIVEQRGLYLWLAGQLSFSPRLHVCYVDRAARRGNIPSIGYQEHCRPTSWRI